MTTRQEIDEAVARWAGKHWMDRPDWMSEPVNEHEFAIAMAVTLATQHPDAWGDWLRAEYDENDELIGWVGIRVKQDPDTP